MTWSFLKKFKHSPECPITNIPKTKSDVRLDESVDRLWNAHDHFSKVLKEFTDDIKKDIERRKTDV